MSLMSDLGTKVGGEFKAHRLRLEAEHKATQYQRDRKYPSVGEQLDMIYHAGLGGDLFQDTIRAVKEAHPKGA
jgi:hypothetical protein